MKRFISQRTLHAAALTFAVAFIAAANPASANPASAQTTPQHVKFAKNADHATLKGTLKGPAKRSADYVVDAKAGQTLTVALKAKNKGTTFFNVYAPGTSDRETEGKSSSELKVPADGAYTVRVFLTSSASTQGASSSYELTVTAH
jgi:hypothetical protein